MARLIGANIVADYWADRPYASRLCLPPIVTIGVPWAVWPDRVHVLDLSPELTRRALLRSRALADLDRATRVPAALPPAPTLLGASAIVFVRLAHSAAVLVPAFQQALYSLLVTAHYAPEKPEAEAAARMAASLFHALLPDLSRHMTRRPDQLAHVRRAFEATLPKATRLHAALATDGVTSLGVSLARALFGARVSSKDVTRWVGCSVRDLALAALAARLHKSRKTLQDQLRLWEKADGVRESWQEFVGYWATLSEAERHRALLFP